MIDTTVVAKSLVFYNDKLLLLRRSKTDPRRPLEWDLPGGRVEETNPATAAARELQEEAGQQIDADTFQLVFTKTALRGDRNVCWLFYVVRSNSDAVTLSYEHDKYWWATSEEATEALTYEVQAEFLAHV